ncbi:MAG: hypothetical protein WA807_13445 [Steroidobacteraceae bacterium]
MPAASAGSNQPAGGAPAAGPITHLIVFEPAEQIAAQALPGNDYRPGNAETVSLGVRYSADPKWIPQLQVNVSHKSPDQGALADTAGTVAYLSPDLTALTTHRLYVYAVVQVPVYSNLSGYQLFPHWTEGSGTCR